jgi:hypothetical protein
MYTAHCVSMSHYYIILSRCGAPKNRRSFPMKNLFRISVFTIIALHSSAVLYA